MNTPEHLQGVPHDIRSTHIDNLTDLGVLIFLWF
jgi:hypothetical protein